MEGNTEVPLWKASEEQGRFISFLGPAILEILDALPFYVLMVDRNHRILLANRATRDHLGVEPDNIVGEYCPRVVHGVEEGTYAGCPLEEAVETQEPVEKIHYDEELGRWMRVAMYPTQAWTVDGEKMYFHMIEDITEQVTREESLKEYRHKYEVLLDEMTRLSRDK